MPVLHIEFDENGGTLFGVRYKPTSGAVWAETTVAGSPADITVPTIESYDYCITKICAPDTSSIEICGTAEYRPPCETPEFSFEERNGNDFVFNFALTPAQFQYDIEVTTPSIPGVQIFRYQLADSPSPVTLNLPNLLTGLYRFRLRGVCGVDADSPISNWTDYVDVNVAVSVCQAPSGIIPTFSPINLTPYGTIVWQDTETYEDRTSASTLVKITVLDVADPESDDITSVWQRSDNGGSTWLNLIDDVIIGDENDLTVSSNLLYQFRLKMTDTLGNIGYSNVLQYTKIAATKVIFQRSIGATTYSVGICGYSLTTGFYLDMQNPPTIPTNGDRAFTMANVPFNGGNKYYAMAASIAAIGDDGFICKIDINGYVTLMHTCPGVVEV